MKKTSEVVQKKLIEYDSAATNNKELESMVGTTGLVKVRTITHLQPIVFLMVKKPSISLSSRC